MTSSFRLCLSETEGAIMSQHKHTNVSLRVPAALWDNQVHRWSGVTPAERLLASGPPPCCDAILLCPRCEQPQHELKLLLQFQKFIYEKEQIKNVFIYSWETVGAWWETGENAAARWTNQRIQNDVKAGLREETTSDGGEAAPSLPAEKETFPWSRICLGREANGHG